MAKTYQMTWRAKGKRWAKKINGHQYIISCRKLEKLYPELMQSATKEGSSAAANKWIQAKLNEVARHPDFDEITEAITIRRTMVRWCQLSDLPKWQEMILSEVDVLQKGLDARTPLTEVYVPHYHHNADNDPNFHMPAKEMWGQNVSNLSGVNLDPFTVSQNETYMGLGVSRADWDNHIQQAQQHDQWATDKASTDDDMTNWLPAYLETLDEKSNGHRRNIEQWVQCFIKWQQKNKGTASANAITELDLMGYRKYLKEDYPAGGHTTSRGLNLLKTFIRWLAEDMAVIDNAPRNLNSKKLSIAKGESNPKTWTDAQVKMIDTAPDRIKLYCLLSLNLGYYASDIASLTHDNVDWEKGTIRSNRHKTGQGDHLEFELWDETFRLLKQERSDHEELVLTNNRGGVLWSDEQRKDCVGKAWRDWRGTQPALLDCRLKDLRKTGRSKFNLSAEYKHCVGWYRREASSKIDDVSYNAAEQKQFSAAITWLGSCWGW